MHMSMATFTNIRDFIYAQSGLFFSEQKKYVLEGRLLPRLRERNCTSYEEYYSILRHDAWRDKELNALFNLVTTNETYFYRDAPQLQSFIDIILPAIMDANQRTQQLRLWSAACSTGDEAYTLAMLLLESPPLEKWGVEILASDLSESNLHAARKGVYGPYAVRHVPPALLKKHFIADGEQYAVSPRLKRLVKFANLNLYDSPRIRMIRGIDVVFCRNCLIYFDTKARQRIVDHLYDSLRPGGYLVIGFSESLHNVSRAFRPINANRSVIYQKI